MDYYEELGIPRSASQEEIRAAWKRLALLLHPDRQPDEPSRGLAELQMRRANEIMAVLGDPVRRRHYDVRLLEGRRPNGIEHAPGPEPAYVPYGRRFGADPYVWGAAAISLAILIAGALVWASRDRPDATPVRTDAVPGHARDLPLTTHSLDAGSLPQTHLRASSRLKKDNAAFPSVPDPRSQTLSRSLPNSGQRVVESPPDISNYDSDVVAKPPLPLLPSIQGSDAPPPPAATLVGTWVYLKPPVQEKLAPHVHPPEFIQLWVQEDAAGNIFGNYLARYTAGGQLISPNVEFQFHGHNPSSPVFQWQGNDGAEGKIELRMVNPNSLRVHWTTTRTGSVNSLMVGNALLTRTDGS